MSVRTAYVHQSRAIDDYIMLRSTHNGSIACHLPDGRSPVARSDPADFPAPADVVPACEAAATYAHVTLVLSFYDLLARRDVMTALPLSLREPAAACSLTRMRLRMVRNKS